LIANLCQIFSERVSTHGVEGGLYIYDVYEDYGAHCSGRLSMSTFRWLTALLLSTACVLGHAGVKTFGKALTLKQKTRLVDLLAAPEKFNGKKVQVQGLITWVCPDRGCSLKLGASRKEIVFRIATGASEFPVSAKGSMAVVEGTFRVQHLKFDKCEVRRRPEPCKLETLEMYIDGADGGVEIEN
jgi:hypothetical protein